MASPDIKEETGATEEGDGSGAPAPRGMERRLVLRLLIHWRELCGAREFPALADIDPAAIPEMWASCFVIGLDHDTGRHCFSRAGESFAGFSPIALDGLAIEEAPTDTLVSQALGFLPEVVRQRVPVSRGGEFVSNKGSQVLYRSILLPLSDDGTTLNALLGAANCREVVTG